MRDAADSLMAERFHVLAAARAQMKAQWPRSPQVAVAGMAAAVVGVERVRHEESVDLLQLEAYSFADLHHSIQE